MLLLALSNESVLVCRCFVGLVAGTLAVGQLHPSTHYQLQLLQRQCHYSSLQFDSRTCLFLRTRSLLVDGSVGVAARAARAKAVAATCLC